MAADQPDRLAVQEYADRYFRPDHISYITFAGLVEGVLEDEDVTDAERVAEIRLAMAALDLRLAEDADRPAFPHAPACPPYGSELEAEGEGGLEDCEREAIARESSLRTADVIARFLRGEY